MNPLMSKVLSLKENIDKLNLEEDTKNKILFDVSDILCDMTQKIHHIEERLLEMDEYVTVLDENLGNVEEEVYGFEDEEEEFHSEDYIDIVCDNCHEVLAIEKEFINNEDKMICPNCQDTINLK